MFEPHPGHDSRFAQWAPSPHSTLPLGVTSEPSWLLADCHYVFMFVLKEPLLSLIGVLGYSLFCYQLPKGRTDLFWLTVPEEESPS